MDQITRLEKMLAAREGQSGFKENCEAIRQKLDLLKNAKSTASQSSDDAQPERLSAVRLKPVASKVEEA